MIYASVFGFQTGGGNIGAKNQTDSNCLKSELVRISALTGCLILVPSSISSLDSNSVRDFVVTSKSDRWNQIAKVD